MCRRRKYNRLCKNTTSNGVFGAAYLSSVYVVLTTLRAAWHGLCFVEPYSRDRRGVRPWPLGSVPEPWRPAAREEAGGSLRGSSGRCGDRSPAGSVTTVRL